MRNRKDFIIALTLCLAMVMSSVAGVYATSASEKRKQANEAGKKAEQARESADDMSYQAHMLLAEIEDVKTEIAETTSQLEAKQEEVDAQSEALNKRLVVMYKTGTVGFVDVILSSEGITELIQNVNVVQKVLENDQNLLKELQDQYKEIEELKAKQEEQQKELEDKKAEVDALKEEYEKLADDYEAQEEELNAEADKLAAEAAAAAANQGGSFSPSGTYCWPTQSNYIITSNYGYRICPFHGSEYHNGLDICLSGGSYGKPVYAIGDGVVTRASWYGGYGNCITVNNGNGIIALYGHLSGYNCSSGQTVSKGQVIGYIGSTGNSTGAHLHFTVFKNGSAINPWSLY